MKTIFLALLLSLTANANTFLETFKVGQAVGVKEVNNKYEITITDDKDFPLPYKVTEIGKDYIKLTDIAGTELQIPVTSIRNTKKINFPKYLPKNHTP